MKIIISIIAVLAAISVVSGTSPDGVIYPFSINDLLVCYVDNPLRGQDGQEDVVPEDIPELPFTQIVRQGSHPNVIWMPEDVQFRIPLGVPDTQALIAFLGSDYNPELTSTVRPTRTAPFGCVTAGTEGSGGVPTIHEATNQSATPLLDLDQATFRRVQDEILSDPSQGIDTSFDFDTARVQLAQTILLRQTNNEPVLWAIWTGLCPLSTVWAELPLAYYPSFLAQGTCSNKNCSHPRAKHCEEDFSYTGYATVLRWDCCFNKQFNQVRWDCGWRKVRVPILCDCSCACGEVFPQT